MNELLIGAGIVGLLLVIVIGYARLSDPGLSDEEEDEAVKAESPEERERARFAWPRKNAKEREEEEKEYNSER